VIELQETMDRLVSERLDLIQQRDGKLRQVTHLAEMVADLKLQLESLQQQDTYKTQLYGMYSLHVLYMYVLSAHSRTFHNPHLIHDLLFLPIFTIESRVS